jgi:hypothetical protein
VLPGSDPPDPLPVCEQCAAALDSGSLPAGGGPASAGAARAGLLFAGFSGAGCLVLAIIAGGLGWVVIRFLSEGFH